MRKTLTMKFSSEEIERFIQAIEEDEHLRARVERAILSDRMYELPDKLAELTELVTEYVKKTDERLSHIESDIGVLKSDVGTLKSDVGTLKSDVEVLKSDVEVLKSDGETLKSDAKVLKSDVGTLKGYDYERRCKERAPSILGLTYGGLKRLRSIRREQLADGLDDALDEGKITQKERDDALNTDMAMKALSKQTGNGVYLAVEVSVVADRHDVERASQRAATLERTFGDQGIGVVIARTIPADLDTSGVEVAIYDAEDD
jgi:chromosome segregation ATPase